MGKIFHRHEFDFIAVVVFNCLIFRNIVLLLIFFLKKCQSDRILYW